MTNDNTTNNPSTTAPMTAKEAAAAAAAAEAAAIAAAAAAWKPPPQPPNGKRRRRCTVTIEHTRRRKAMNQRNYRNKPISEERAAEIREQNKLRQRAFREKTKAAKWENDAREVLEEEKAYGMTKTDQETAAAASSSSSSSIAMLTTAAATLETNKDEVADTEPVAAVPKKSAPTKSREHQVKEGTSMTASTAESSHEKQSLAEPSPDQSPKRGNETSESEPNKRQRLVASSGNEEPALQHGDDQQQEAVSDEKRAGTKEAPAPNDKPESTIEQVATTKKVAKSRSTIVKGKDGTHDNATKKKSGKKY